MWAASVSDALLVRLASVRSGARVDVIDFEPCGPLARLDAAELEGLHSVVVACAVASDDESVVQWCTLLGSASRRLLPPRIRAGGDRRRKIGGYGRAKLLFPDGGRPRTAEEIEEIERWGEKVRREQEGRRYPPGL